MKFLCVDCDQAMVLREAKGPDEGSMTVIFGCQSCGREIAMLTNEMETQMVRSLGVKIGGRTAARAPMETVRHTVIYRRDGVLTQAGTTAEDQPVRESAGYRCPFTDVVAGAADRRTHPGDPVWTAEAEARVGRIPSFVQPMVRKSIEQHAREKGYREINNAVVDEIRDQLGM